MEQGKQTDDWAHTAALIGTIGGIFSGGVDVARFLPAHLKPRPAAPAIDAGGGMAALRTIVLSGSLG